MTQTPKEKAKSLAWKFALKSDPSHDGDLPSRLGKELAEIAVDQIINELFDEREEATAHNNSRIRYWQEVKNHLNAM